MADILATIAIPTYNRAKLLQKTLECMTSQDTKGKFNYEILVIDDGSTDRTRAVIKDAQDKFHGRLRYIWQEGEGYTHALNVAVREFTGEWLAFFDDDQITHASWLSQLLQAAGQQNAKMVGGPIVLDLPEEILARIGPVCRDIFGESPDIRDPQAYKQTPPFPSGGNRMVHRSVFELVGDFDENMLTGGCDRDFLLRAIALGVPMGWARGAVARHIIDPARFTPGHIKWYSLQWGCAFAYTDWKRWGGLKTCIACIARIGQALVINLPMFFYHKAKGDEAGEMDRRALLWRAVGYSRKTLNLLSPGIFPQNSFFEQVEFRRIRKTAQPA